MHSTLLSIGADWWLPANYAVHGRETDALFAWFFWITLSVLVAVQAALVLFVLKYRRRTGHSRAKYFARNNRLEFLWTAVTALVIASLAYGSERVWRDYRSSPDLNNPQRSRILIIGQQFKWNVIYPGPDGKFGRYLIYPKPSDTAWPVRPDGKPQIFAGVPGPASLPFKQAVEAINTYIDSKNPLGKDFSDPDGKDDDWSFAPGRPIFVPVNRPVEIDLESKDVIHDFFIPNFRAQLYAIPGMMGRFVFTPTITTRQLETSSQESLSIDQLRTKLSNPTVQLNIDINAQSQGATSDNLGWAYVDNSMKNSPIAIIRDQQPLTPEIADKLHHAGISTVKVHPPRPFEVACAQLCGAQHYTMRNTLIVLSQEEFDRRFPAVPHVH